jgi:hypothetical protein
MENFNKTRELTTMEKVWIEVALKDLLKKRHKIKHQKLLAKTDVLKNLVEHWNVINTAQITPSK